MKHLKDQYTGLTQYISSHPRQSLLVGMALVLFVVFLIVGGSLSNKGGSLSSENDAEQVADVVKREEEASQESYEELKSPGALQVFTHFPADFEEFFAAPEDVLRKFQEHKDTGGAVHEHVSPPFAEFFFDPLNKGIGGRRWGFANPHMPPVWNEELDMEIDEWPSYLVADVTLKLEDIWTDFDWGTDEPLRFTDVDPATLVSKEINGDMVYYGVSLLFRVDENIYFSNGGKEWVRKALIDEVIAQGGTARLLAGTHYGYGDGSFALVDERVDSGGYPGAANPFDYFTTELQEKLLTLQEPYHRYYKEQGTEPFKNPTESRQWWDEQGLLAGAWTNNDFMPDGFDLPDGEWRAHISLVIPEYIVTETFWRVLEHPWNMQNNMVGLWIENQVPYRFYVLDGDLSEGVGMAIHPWNEGGNGYSWDPLKPDSSINHPSFGKRWYFRFEVTPNTDMWSEMVKIERFKSEQAAKAGFTDNAVVYKRGFSY